MISQQSHAVRAIPSTLLFEREQQLVVEVLSLYRAGVSDQQVQAKIRELRALRDQMRGSGA